MVKVLIRMELGGALRAFSIETEAVGNQVEEMWNESQEEIPSVYKAPAQAFLFAMRHGPFHKIMKLIKPTREEADGKTISILLQAVLQAIAQKSVDENGNPIPIDVTGKDMAEMYHGVIQREPQFDLEHIPQLEEPESEIYGFIESSASFATSTTDNG